MPPLHRGEAAAPRLRPGDQGEPHLQHAAGAGRDLGRRAPGLYRPRPRPREGRLHGLDGKERVGGMSDFLLELLSEEIPARMQDKARADLARLFEEQLSEAGLTGEAVETYATPRRLVLIARGLPDRTEAVSEEIKGPRTAAPPQALEGFLRKTGLTQDRLEERDGIWFATV